MQDFIIIAILVVILGAAALYLYKAKKRGAKCIGCPDGAKCSGNCDRCSGGCNCNHPQNKQ